MTSYDEDMMRRIDLRLIEDGTARPEGTTMKAGVIGLGDMGSGLARNLIKTGFDLSEKRMAAFAEIGGRPAGSAAAAGAFV